MSTNQKFPTAPKNLSKAGKDKWMLGKVLWDEGRLTDRDLINWQLFAEAWDEKAHCEAIAKKDGEYQLGPNGCYVQHPAIKRRKEAENVIRKYSAMYGLVPDARKKSPATQQGVAGRSRT